MADKTIDELIDAIETVGRLRDTLGKHELLITKIVDKLEEVETRLGALEAAQRSRGT